MHLLARTQARALDADVGPGAEAVQRNEIARELGNPDRLPHAQHEDLAALAHQRRLHDEHACFLDGHEIARRVLVAHRHRSAGTYLMDEERNHAPAAREHVPEAHRDEARVAGRIVARNHHGLGEALRRTHDAAWPHRLVRGKHHHAFRSHRVRGVDHVARAKNVVLHRFRGECLHVMDVLVRRRVIHDVRTVLPERALQRRRIARVDDGGHDVALGVALPELALDLVDLVLAPAQEHQALHVEAGELPADLASNRATRARDQDGAPHQEAFDLALVELHRLATEEILGAHVADLLQVHRPLDDLEETGGDAEGHARIPAQRHHAAHELTTRRRHRDEDLVHALCGDRRGQVRGHADHRNTVETCPAQGLGVIQISDHGVLLGSAIGDLSSQHAAGFAGANDQESFLHDGSNAARRRASSPPRPGRKYAPGSCRSPPGSRCGW